MDDPLPGLRKDFKCSMGEKMNGDFLDVDLEADDILGRVQAIGQLEPEQSILPVT
jgi:hypothetical protein